MEPLSLHKSGVLEGCTSVVTGTLPDLRYRKSYCKWQVRSHVPPGMFDQNEVHGDGLEGQLWSMLDKPDWPMILEKGAEPLRHTLCTYLGKPT